MTDSHSGDGATPDAVPEAAPPNPAVFLPPPPTAGDEGYLDMDLLRFTTAGSVDDGKSTLIGRLLYDTKSIFADQLEAVEEASRNRGGTQNGVPNLALLTDGLRAEREQGITIDVAYRYFATPRRKFIVADTPGHVQYTRNMVTGASTADLAIVLVDAKRGVQTQSKRHGFLASVLGIQHVVVAVNKMDLVDYSEAVFEDIVREYTAFASRLAIPDVTFIPVSALLGDNVVERSDAMPWYDGSTLLHHLEHVNVAGDRNLIDFRFPVQLTLRPDASFRGYAGTVASGAIRPGERVVVLPSGTASTVKAITVLGGEIAEAQAGDAVVLSLTDELDVSRGDMIVREKNRPDVGTEVEAMVCWMSEQPMERQRHYLMRHTTRSVQAYVDAVVYRVDVDTLHREDADRLGLNDIGRVRLTTASPICFDPYRQNAETGAFILIDPYSNATVAAGMIRGGAEMTGAGGTAATRAEAARTQAARAARAASPNVVWEGLNIARATREARQGHRAGVLWLTGLSGAGKTAIAREVERQLFERGATVVLLDGDHVRHGLSGDLGFSAADRHENVRRAGEVARLFYETGAVVLCTFVSPVREDRDGVRALFAGTGEGDADGFAEALVTAAPATLRARDPKGLYARAEAGEVRDFSGVSAPYEAPAAPELLLDTDVLSIDAAVAAVIAHLDARGCVPR